MNKVIAIIAFVLLSLILMKALAAAWLGMKVLSFVSVILAFLIVGWFWGRSSK